jgi:hypothetical protein
MSNRIHVVLLAAVATSAAGCIVPDPNVFDCLDRPEGCAPVEEPTPAVEEPVEEPIVAVSCEDLKRQVPEADDGPYEIVVAGRPLEVHCADMGFAPIEYLPLRPGNFSQYTADASQGTSVRTEFSRVRLDLDTMTIDMADFSFASSQGSLRHGDSEVFDMPFGVAMSCTGDADGAAHIDLRGTGLAVDDTWRVAGSGAGGTFVRSEGDQVVDVSGGGYCGWNYPGEAFNPFNDNAGFDLQVRWIDEPATPVVAESCLDLKTKDSSATDGIHSLVVGGRDIDIHCADMASGSPREYLPLHGENFSQYTASPSQGSTVRTDFDAVRIDLGSLTVDMGDLRFTSSTGSLQHGSDTVTAMPYGVAMSCTGAADGAARIDLTGTPLAVFDGWVVAGSGAGGDAEASEGGQVIDIVGGGYCGWNAPGSAYNPYNDNAGFDLQLRWD